eukprot:COSAG06_NODE_5574_length_3393_cov_37.370370_2_plen_91_part_00
MARVRARGRPALAALRACTVLVAAAAGAGADQLIGPCCSLSLQQCRRETRGSEVPAELPRVPRAVCACTLLDTVRLGRQAQQRRPPCTLT